MAQQIAAMNDFPFVARLEFIIQHLVMKVGLVWRFYVGTSAPSSEHPLNWEIPVTIRRRQKSGSEILA